MTDIECAICGMPVSPPARLCNPCIGANEDDVRSRRARAVIVLAKGVGHVIWVEGAQIATEFVGWTGPAPMDEMGFPDPPAELIGVWMWEGEWCLSPGCKYYADDDDVTVVGNYVRPTVDELELIESGKSPWKEPLP